MQQTSNIQKFLETYSDQRLAEFKAHTQDGKTSYFSCCCLIGARDAEHALKGEIPEFHVGAVRPADTFHHIQARHGIALGAESEFYHLGSDDAERRERLLPLIEAEEARRSQMRLTVAYSGDAGDEQAEFVSQ